MAGWARERDKKRKTGIVMSTLVQLRQFLIAANKAGYASGKESQWKKEKDKSTTISFSLGDWYTHDNFFGGEPYGGRFVVFHKERPYWIMVYYGYIKENVSDINEVYKILREALKLMPKNLPLRGPKIFKLQKFTYKNKWEGTLSSYSGKEEILSNGKKVYQANYMGGLVDQREGV